MLPHASAYCLGGRCGLAVCESGYFDCNRIASDGCESMSLCLDTVVTFNASGSGRSGGLQRWTVPPGVTTVSIEAWGAQGGGSPTTGGCNCSLPGGRGAYVRGTFSVTPGSVLDLLVGQVGGSSGGAHGNENGGGGGTFVVLNPRTPLVIAGGGGGGPSTTYGSSCARTASVGDGQAGNGGASTSCSTSAAGGSAGSGGAAAGTYEGGAGGGFTGDGANGGTHCVLAYGGSSYTNGGVGGLGNNCYDTNNFGGYGGGGGGQLGGPGGGGGYSGGSTSGAWSASSSYGGGGGSYNAGAGQTNTAGVRSGMGMVTIRY